jgi:hypothetical protein
MAVGIKITVVWDGTSFFFFFFLFDGDQQFGNLEVASSSEELLNIVPSMNIRI